MTRTGAYAPHRGGRRGFTLIELLVVITIILLVSAVALPTVLPALSHREVSEAGRILQAALAGARDKAIHDGQPSGLRLLPDPNYSPLLQLGTSSTISPYSILAYNRVVPIGPAPEYTDGYCMPTHPNGGPPAYSGATLSNAGVPQTVYPNALLLLESPVDPGDGTVTPAPNPPTSWFWNIRVGDKIQLNNSGPWYTIIGPMKTLPQGGNPEMFVNAGPPGAPNDLKNFLPQLTYTVTTTDSMGNATTSQAGPYPTEYLVLVNGKDDNNNGWIDEGFDGIDNDNDGKIDILAEWEQETWPSGVLSNGQAKVPYTIRRRPAPLPGSREIALPTSMVIDATSMLFSYSSLSPGSFGGGRERSRLPINLQTLYSGIVDIVLNPDGTVVPTMDYSTPASFGMDQAFYHFWLAERQDLNAMNPNGQAWAAGAPYYLPIAQPGGSHGSIFPGPYLKGQYSILSLATRTGQIYVNENPPFFLDPTIGYTNSPGAGASTSYYNSTYPFIQAEQGVTQGP